MSGATPTMVFQFSSLSDVPSLMRRPIGSSSGKNRVANAWITSTTSGASASSCRVKSRPRSTATSNVWK